jgi:hypothetical protein
MEHAEGKRRGMKTEDRIIEEKEFIAAVPCGLTRGGYLERKDGQMCLRFGDEVVLMDDGRCCVTRRWVRPGSEPWDRDLYETRDEEDGK